MHHGKLDALQAAAVFILYAPSPHVSVYTHHLHNGRSLIVFVPQGSDSMPGGREGHAKAKSASRKLDLGPFPAQNENDSGNGWPSESKHGIPLHV